MATARRIEGYAIVSDDGMLADANRHMPDQLKVEGDQIFFERALDGVDVVVHGRHSQEQQARAPQRLRLILSTHVAGIAPDPHNAKARLWNPAGATFEQALDALGARDPVVAVIGGPQAFGLFLDRYDVFYLSRAPGVRLPGGRPVFPEVPALTPEQVLAEHGYEAFERCVIDEAKNVEVVGWRRRGGPGQIGRPTAA